MTLSATIQGSVQSETSGWQARINIDLGLVAGATRPTYVSHFGPLRIQRPFYPEDDGTCHLVLLHPPGGVVGNDSLKVNIETGADARSLITTPAATKLYRCLDAPSRILQEISAKAGAYCEWLPQETIVFKGARSRLTTRILLEGDAQFIGWEILCLGRPTANEAFDKGQVLQALELYRDGRPLLLERLRIGSPGCARTAPWGLSEHSTTGTMLLSGSTASLVDALRAEIAELTQSKRFACTELEGCVVVRYVGPSVPECWRVFNEAWRLGRKNFGRKAPSPPRIWKC